MRLWWMLITLLINVPAHCAPFALGIENIPDELLVWMRTQRVGLVTNQSGHDQSGKRTLDLLLEKEIPVIKLLVPEHGIHGKIPAGSPVADSYDHATQIPIVSLYGQGSGKKIDQSMLKDIQLIMLDLQDVGMRHFTYISTLRAVLEAAAHANKYVIVCDRPNPLGLPMEGPLVEPELISFISAAPIPLRHGMTIGELARYFNVFVIEKKAQLCVVPMKGYGREHGLPRTCSAQISPNLNSLEACFGYSFLGLLGEVRPFDVGMGSDRVFQCLCLPERLGVSAKAWQGLASTLAQLNIESKPYIYYSTRKKQQFRGLEIKISDINKISSWKVFIQILAFFKQIKVPLTCSPDFDKAVGNYQVRQFIEGGLQPEELQSLITKPLEQFANRARQVHLY